MGETSSWLSSLLVAPVFEVVVVLAVALVVVAGVGRGSSCFCCSTQREETEKKDDSNAEDLRVKVLSWSSFRALGLLH